MENNEFDLSSGTVQEMRVWSIASEVMHSHLLTLLVDDRENFEGFLISSYRNRSQRAVSVSFDDWVEVLDGIANDKITQVDLRRDVTTGNVIPVRT